MAPGAGPSSSAASGERATLVFDVVDRVEHDPHAERRVAWHDFVPHI